MFSKLDELMEAMTSRGIPACDLAVTKDGKSIYRKMVGFSDSKGTKPVSENDLYWIFSASKVITCIAALRLIERGLISVDDPVSKYIPEYAELKVKAKGGVIVPASNVMTIEHLFTMTGGMSYVINTENILYAIEHNPSTLGVVKAMAKDPLLFEPGTRYKYSLCHDVLAAVVEVASGMKFSEYLKKNIFEPLGIKDMGFRPSEEQLTRFSAMYTYRNGLGEAIEKKIENKYALIPEYDSGGAGLFCSVDEYMKIITAVACGGRAENGYELLKPETVKMMTLNRQCDAALDDFAGARYFGYGWGLCCRTHMNPTLSLSLSPVGECGWDGAAGAFSMIDTTNRIALYFGMHVMGCNYVYQMIHPRIRNLVYEELL
ncbi:MAG: beta-lactamase family protein [Clostridia bacterium]|nr:beta-lactamase family protein [Clostridia bacterium]